MADLLAKREHIKASRLNKHPSSYLDRLAQPSRRQYSDQLALWQRFKTLISEPDAVPHPDNLRLFAWWCASNSNGRLAELADVKTLCYNIGRFGRIYNKSHEYQLSAGDIKDAREYIRTELALELGLQDLEHSKEYADWEDVKITICHLIVEDPHIYHNNRYLVQLVFVFLLIADDGERSGAIVRSEAYRESEIALCYQDIELYLRPGLGLDGGPRFKLKITYNNRKGERNKKEHLVQIYFQRTDLAHCVIVWFIVLAFLDDAFEDNSIRSPAELFNRVNLRTGDIHIRFKASKFQIPILRRMQSCGSRELSPNLPWTAGSVNTEAQRSFIAAGFPQRFTWYCIRRTIANILGDSGVSAGRRKKLMGHDGESDIVFRKYYESETMTIDTGNMFRGEEPRPEKSKVLSMHLKRDTEVPDMPDTMLDEVLNGDKQIQDLLRSRQELKAQLDSMKGDPNHGCNEITLKAACEALYRALNRRRVFLRKHAKTDFRKKFFKDPNLLRSQYPSIHEPQKANRTHLADVLYPRNELEGSALVAVEILLQHCATTGNGHAKSKKHYTILKDTSQCQEETHAFQEPLTSPLKTTMTGSLRTDMSPKDLDPCMDMTGTIQQNIGYEPERLEAEIALEQHQSLSMDHYSPMGIMQTCVHLTDPKPAATEGNALRQSSPAEPDPQHLVHLKETLRLTWNEIASRYPGFSHDALGRRYRKFKSCSPTSNFHEPLLMPLRPAAHYRNTRFTEEDDQILLKLKETERLTWKEIASHFPGRSLDTLASRYRDIKSNREACTPKAVRSVVNYTPQDDQKISQMRDAGLSWSSIAECFPGRSADAVKHHHNSVNKRTINPSPHHNSRKRGCPKVSVPDITSTGSKRRKTLSFVGETDSSTENHEGLEM